MTLVMGGASPAWDNGPVVAKIPLIPAHPERTCWGCDTYCPADDLACGNGTVRTMHPLELFGEDWLEWSTRKAATVPAIADGRNTG
jgi:DUF3079 family protein